MPEVVLPHNWRPRDYQRALWAYLQNGGKRAVACWHRRAGKDDVDLHWTATAAHKRVGTYWYMLPMATQARKAIWEAVNPRTGKRRVDEAFPEEIRSATHNQEMFIRLKCGSSFQVVGSDNFNALMGSPPIGVVFSEWSLSNPTSWAYIRPILLENGGWALFNYTPRGHNHGYNTLAIAQDSDDWFAQVLTADKTGVFTEAQLEAERKEMVRENGEEIGNALFLQEYFCSFDAPMIGSFWGAQMMEAEKDGRICSVPHDPALQVHTWWDVGRDTTAVWFFQQAGHELHFIDYSEEIGTEPADDALMLREKERDNKYVYGRHIWPHDGGHVRKGLGGGSLQSMMYDLGFTMEVQSMYEVQVAIQRVRQILPRCWFDRAKTEPGLDALRSFRKAEDEKNSSENRRYFKPGYVHDWSSHGASAFYTGAMTMFGPETMRVGKRDRYAGKRGGGGSHWAA